MTTLNFEGPFHFGDIKIKKGKPGPGIYIWGFMYYYNKNGIIAPVNFKTTRIQFDKNLMKFIPYYVGMRKTSVFDRLIEHHGVRKGNARKFTRFSHCYMSVFFKDQNFKIPLGAGDYGNKFNMKKLVQSDFKKVVYFNDDKILNDIYKNKIQLDPKGIKGNWPITNQKINNNDLPDTLDDLVNSFDNFWCCFAINDTFKNEALLVEMETNTFWSLKGKTISKTNSCPSCLDDIEIIDRTNTDIFKTNSKSKIKPSEDFPGY